MDSQGMILGNASFEHDGAEMAELIDKSVAGNKGFALEFFRYSHHFEMCLRVWRHIVHTAFIDHIEKVRV